MGQFVTAVNITTCVALKMCLNNSVDDNMVRYQYGLTNSKAVFLILDLMQCIVKKYRNISLTDVLCGYVVRCPFVGTLTDCI